MPAPCLGQHEFLFVVKTFFGLQVLCDFQLKRMLLRGVHLPRRKRVAERLVESGRRRHCGLAIQIDVAAHASIFGRYSAAAPVRSRVALLD